MKTDSKKSGYSTIKSFSEKLYTDKSNYEYLISEDIQLKEIERLKLGLRNEQFFIIVDLLNFEIINLSGLEAFGYDGRNFTLKTYFQMIPPDGITSLLTTLGKQTFLWSKPDLIGFLRPSFVVQMPMRLKNQEDTTFLVKRSISPWQITKCGKITAYLSEFTLIKTYDFEALNPRIVGIPSNYLEEVMKAFNLDFKQLRSNENPFSHKEIQILEKSLSTDLTKKQIAESLEITLLTINGYNKSILEKSRRMFGKNIPVKTAVDVAKYLKNNGLLKY